MAEDKFEELHPDEADGEPVDYDPFIEETIGRNLEECAKSLEKLARAVASNMAGINATLNKHTKVLEGLALAISGRREVVRGEDGRIIATRVVH
jgi:hypothetical protein